MAISKVILNGVTQMDVTQKTVTAATMLSGTTALKNDGTDITGSIASKSSTDLTVNGSTVTAPAGYYGSSASKSVASGSASTPATTITANPSISVNSSTGVITASVSGSKSVTPTVSAGYVSSGTAGTVSVSGSNTSNLSTQAGTTIAPTESEQTAVAAGKYTLGAVKVGAISSTYVGSDIDRRDDTDLTVSGATVSVPAGYYEDNETKSVASGSAGTPTATKGTVSNHSVSITPSVTNTTGYITGGTKTGTAVTVSASDLVSGSKSITANGTGIDVANYSTVDVSVSGDVPTYQVKTGIVPTESSQTITADAGYDALSSVQINAISSTYVGSEIDRRDDTDLTASGATVTVPSGYYADTETKSVVSGSATTPTTSITANPTISVSGSGLITASVSGSKSVTPTVSAGYISSGTAGTVSVSGSNTQQLTTKAATTYNTSSSNQTIASETYLTGTQTIRAVTTSNIDASNIKDGVNVKVGDSASAGRIANVTGTFTDASTVSTGQTAATDGEILTGYSAWVDGAEVQGSLRAMTTSEISAAVTAGWNGSS